MEWMEGRSSNLLPSIHVPVPATFNPTRRQPRAGRENQEGVTGSLTNEIQRRRGDLPPATDSLPGVVPVKGLSPAKTQLSAADSYESALENVVRENAVPSLAGISTLGHFRMGGKGLRVPMYNVLRTCFFFFNSGGGSRGNPNPES